jgi:hypothetical protein
MYSSQLASLQFIVLIISLFWKSGFHYWFCHLNRGKDTSRVASEKQGKWSYTTLFHRFSVVLLIMSFKYALICKNLVWEQLWDWCFLQADKCLLSNNRKVREFLQVSGHMLFILGQLMLEVLEYVTSSLVF